MNIEETKASDLEELKTWFQDKESIARWGGPTFRFPFTHESFLEDCHWLKMPSYSFVDPSGRLMGFGQYYEKVRRCHLARLAIAPGFRGKGHGRRFFAGLIEIGMKELGTQEASLFVLSNNAMAVDCYRALGFKNEPYPEGHERYEGVDFMVLRNA